MLKLFYKIFNSEAAKIFKRFIAGCASAIIVINGFLFYIRLNERDIDSEAETVDELYNVFEEGLPREVQDEKTG